MASQAALTPQACGRCGRTLTAATYDMKAPGGGASRKCLRCALRHRPMVRRSLLIAVIVGTVLTAINQGTLIFRGDFPPALAWKVPLTYAVPFCVATSSALLNARTSPGPGR